MKSIRRFTRKLWMLFRKSGLARELQEEMAFHREQLEKDHQVEGMTAEEAHYAAMRHFGNATRFEEQSHEVGGFFLLESVWQDLCFALRTMRKNAGFTLAVTGILALGIGGNTAMFTVVRAVLLKPLEYPDADKLVRFSLENMYGNKRDGAFSLKRLEELRASAKSFSGIGAFLKYPETVSLSGSGEPRALQGSRVSANFLNILKVKPLRGRSFLAEEDTPGGPAVAMISAKLWRNGFQGDPGVVGKTATFNATPYTIVGVLPDGFGFPFPGTDVWFTRPAEWSVIPGGAWLTILNGFGRLGTNVSLSQAQAEVNVLNRQYVLANSERQDAGAEVVVRLTPLKDYFVANARPTLWMLFGSVGFILLISCANVSGLLLARASSRSREFAMRAAIGATRGRLVRQLLAESLVLAAAGGALGTLLAECILYAIKHFGAPNLPRVAEIRLDSLVLGFTATLSIITGVLSGLLPSLQSSRQDLMGELRESGVGARPGSSRQRKSLGINVRALLLVGQISLSVVLLIGATLLIKSFIRLHSVDPGFQSANLLTAKISLPKARYDTNQKKAAFFRELVERLDSLPGVDSATVALSLPTTDDWLATNVLFEDHLIGDGGNEGTARFQSVMPGYFHALAIPLLRGRELSPQDNSSGAKPVVIVNESFVLQFWPSYPRGQDPVGQHIGEGIDRTGGMEIVGIVADVRERGLDSLPLPEFYVPTAVHAPQVAYLVVRTAGNPLLFANAVRGQVLATDRDQPMSEIRTMDDLLEAPLGQRHLTMVLLGSFACVALLLAVVGIYGVIAYWVAQRTQEIGIRQALGAQRGDILILVLGEGLGITLVGVALGIGAALAVTRVMKSLLFQVSATDPKTFIGIALLFVMVALIACYIPARRATRINPMAALRVG